MSKKIDYGTVTKDVIFNYRAWLTYSKLTENDLLNYRLLRPVRILKEYVNGVLSVSLIIGEEVVGERFVSTSVKNNDEFMIDVSFILLYIAQRLDDKNRSMPFIGYCEKDEEYYYSKVKEFLKNNS